MKQIPKTVLLFGDSTEPWASDVDNLYQQADSAPWLHDFLADVTNLIKTEKKVMEPLLQDSIGEIVDLRDLCARYRQKRDELSFVQGMMVYVVRAASLLQCIKREPHLLATSRIMPIGISGGLINASVLAVSRDFESLYETCVETAKVFCRFCRLTVVRSRAIEDQPGAWGWAVMGISAQDLSKTLDQFQSSVGIPPNKMAKIGVVGDRWSTVIGPPSVLGQFFSQCPSVRTLPKNELNIGALQHTMAISTADLDYIVGDSVLRDRPLIPNFHLWGMDKPGAAYGTWGELIRDVVLQVLARRLDMVEAVRQLASEVGSSETTKVKVVGPSSHAAYLSSILKANSGLNVSVQTDMFEREPRAEAPGRIAIVGMAGIGPGCNDVSEFWDIILAQQDLAREIPADRFDISDFYAAEHKSGECTTTSKFGCFIDKPGHFDARFFKISPREAELMDPNHRLFLMKAYEALEMAGYSDGSERSRSTDPRRIGTFFGQCNDDWRIASHDMKGCDAYTLQSTQRAFGPGRLAFQMKWEGPTYSLDSACSSSSSAIHLASMSLLSGDIDLAVTGAANIVCYPHSQCSLSKSGVLSNTGNCKPYRDDADGYCRADFVGAVVLKRLEDAVASNDNILAVVAGSGRNHSGNSTSITTSDAAAQERLFRNVLRNARVSADDISFVEMHGTGTQVGDPAEMGAVTSVFGDRPSGKPLPVGAVKGNFGHSESAAGMASLLKCIMMFQNDIIPPQAGMPHALNPKFPPLSEANITIPSTPQAFVADSGKPRRILLNNFDAAGGNACLLLEDFVKDAPVSQEDDRPCHVVVTSAKTPSSHQANQRNLLTWLRANPGTKIQDVAYTTTARKTHHAALRFACAASTTEDLIEKLEASLAQGPPSGAASAGRKSPVVFVFTGQGSHYAGMGHDLYGTNPTFRQAVDLCARICADYDFPAFLPVITDGTVDMSTMNTIQTQLAVLTLEIALAAFWQSVGVVPDAVMGHSLGEYAALHVSGVLSLADTLYLVGRRAMLLMQQCEEGACGMLAVSAGAASVEEFLDPDSSCGIACINSTKATVVSGTLDDVLALEEKIQTTEHAGSAMSKIKSKQLTVPFGFHSFQMEPILREFAALASGVTYSPPKIPVASTLLGAVVETPGTFGAEYMARQTREPVNFVGALGAVRSKFSDDGPLWVEVGPGPVCGSFLRATPQPRPETIMSTLESGVSAWTSISKCLAGAYVSRIDVDWLAFHRPYERGLNLLALPPYAWDLKDYWITYDNSKALVPRSTTSASGLPPISEPAISTCAQRVVTKSLSPKITVTLTAALADPGFRTLVHGHRIRDVPICPGTAFSEAALTAAKYVLDMAGRKDVVDDVVRDISIRDMALAMPLTEARAADLVTTAVLDGASGDTIRVTFKASSDRAAYELGGCTLKTRAAAQVQAGWDKTSLFVKNHMDTIIQDAKERSGHKFQPAIFYALFSSTVKYHPAFKCIEEAYVSADFTEAVAEVVLRADPAGSRFTASPYWVESLVHLAGFVVNGDPERVSRDSTFMMDTYESFDQTASLEAGRSYFTYARISRREKDTAYCDVYVFDDEDKMVIECSNLRFHEVGNATLDRLLGKSASGPVSGSPATETTRQKPVASASRDIPKIQETKAPAIVETVERQDVAESSDSKAEALETLLETIAKQTGTDISELTDDMAIAEVGVDSIMAIEITAHVNNNTGMDLLPSFVVEYPTIGDLRRAFGGKPTRSTPPVPAPAPAPVHQAKQTTETPVSRSGDSTPTSIGSSLVLVEDGDEMGQSSAVSPPAAVEDLPDNYPEPRVRISLMQGRPAPGKQAFYIIADGLGTIATYIHLPPFKSPDTLVYGVDSPFLHCPKRFTTEVGIPGAAKHITAALASHQPTGPFALGGFSGGAMLGYEVSRQLAALGRKVDGLMLIDMCCPRPRPSARPSASQAKDAAVDVEVFEHVSSHVGFWNMAPNTQQHLRAVFASVSTYHPPPMTAAERPARTMAIWARKGMVNRCLDNPELLERLASRGLGVDTEWPGFMEDPKLGAIAWSILNKTDRDLGPNGWEKYIGADVPCWAVDADHLEMVTPGQVHLLRETMEEGFAYLEGGK